MPSTTKFFDVTPLTSRRFLWLVGIVLWPSAASAVPLPPTVVSLETKISAEESSWEDRSVPLPPFFWLEKDKDRRFVMVSLLYWDWSDKTSSQKLFLPLFYSGRDDDSRLFVSLPLVIGYRRPGESWWVAGNFFRSRDARLTRTGFFPLYWQQSRAGGGRVTSLLPFLFYDYRSQDRSRIDQVWLGGYRRLRGTASRGLFLNTAWARSPDAGFRTFFPLYWHTHAPEGGIDLLGPLYHKWENAPEGKRQARGLFPLVGWGGSSVSPVVRSHYLFPFYYYSRGLERTSWITLLASRTREGERSFGHLGLYFYDRDPSEWTAGVFPFWSRTDSADGFTRRTQVLNFVDQRAGDQHFQTVFPLYGYWRTPEGSKFLSWGVWRRCTDLWTAEGAFRGRDVSGWAFLFHWKSDPEGRQTQVLFPLWWRYKRPPDWKMDLLFPVYFHYRDGPLSLTATPFFIHARQDSRDSWSWLFLYWDNHLGEKKSHLLFPFYYRETSPLRRAWATPLFWARRGLLSREGAFPLGYWYHSAEKDKTFVLPLYGHSRTLDRQWTVVGPAYSVSAPHRGSYGLFPLWGRFFNDTERGSYLLPFYWASGNGRGEGSLVLPLFLTYVDQRKVGTPERERHVNYLLLGSVVQKGADLSHGFFPLYQYVREKEFENFWAPRVLPLVAWERRPHLRQGYVFPHWWKRSPASDVDVVFPLWFSQSRYMVEEDSAPVRGSLTGRWQVFFPLYWHGRTATRSATYVPPLYARIDEGRRRWRVVTPLGWSVDTEAGGKFRLFFPIYWRVLTSPRPDAAAKDISVVGPWYRIQSDRNGVPTRTVGLSPLFSSTTAVSGDRSFDLLGGLFGRDRRDRRVRYRLLYVFSWTTGAKTVP